jgi:hypothetical protein
MAPIREGAKVLDGPRAQALEDRKQLVAYAGSQEARVAVGGVQDEWNLVAGNVGFHVYPPRAIEGADAIAVEGGQYGEPFEARAAQQAHEERLGAVVGVVTGGDSRAAGARCRSA